MPLTAATQPRRDAFAELRATLANAHAEAAPAAFTLAEEAVLRTGFPALDAALGGGVPRGIIATLEGALMISRLENNRNALRDAQSTLDALLTTLERHT